MRLRSLLVALALATHPLGAQGDASCRFTFGPTMRVRQANGARVYVEPDAALMTPQGLMVLGAPTYVWRVPTGDASNMQFDQLGGKLAVDSIAGILVDTLGVATLVDLPGGVHRTRAPALLQTPDGVEAIFNANTTKHELTDTIDLRYARFAGGHWSAAQSIARILGADWDRNTHSKLVRWNGEYWVAFGLRSSSFPRILELAMLHGGPGHWHIDTLATGVGAGSPVLRAQSTTLELFMVGARGEAGKPDANSLYQSSRATSGAWTSSTRIEYGFPDGVFAPELIEKAGEDLIVFRRYPSADYVPAFVKRKEAGASEWSASVEFDHAVRLHSTFAYPMTAGDATLIVTESQSTVADTATNSGSRRLYLVTRQGVAPQDSRLGAPALLPFVGGINAAGALQLFWLSNVSADLKRGPRNETSTVRMTCR